MRVNDGDRLAAIVYLIDLVEADLKGVDEQLFLQDLSLIDATTHRLMHIGENAIRLSAAVRLRNPELPWDRMASLRNFAAHDYFGISEAILWQTARNSLQALSAMCIAELAAEQRNEGE